MAMKSFDGLQSFDAWYDVNISTLTRTLGSVERLISFELENANIQYLPILSRIKTKTSARDKLKAKLSGGEYEITDLIGLRVVVLLENDIDHAAQAISRVFEIDQANCSDKRKASRVDSLGYRSLHLVASLGKDRSGLPEYRGLCDLKFEIQIRTALQHTWAEIEHKRNYKGQFALPPDLERRLMVLSGTLELIDREFSQISVEADQYRMRIESSDKSTDDDAISYIATVNLISVIVTKSHPEVEVKLSSASHAMIAKELTDFGVETIGELSSFLSDPKLGIIIDAAADDGEVYAVGLLRDLMICVDAEKYFRNSFKGNFSVMEISNLDYLIEASGDPNIGRIISSHGVDLIVI